MGQFSWSTDREVSYLVRVSLVGFGLIGLLLGACSTPTLEDFSPTSTLQVISPTATLPATPSPPELPLSTSAAAAVIWERTGASGVCQSLTIETSGAYLWEDCQNPGSVEEGMLSSEQQQRLQAMLDQLASFQGQTQTEGQTERYVFYGRGQQPPAEADEANLRLILIQLVGEKIGVGPTPTPTGSGIEGQVLIGPNCPGPVRIEQPCPDLPYQALLTILTTSNEVVAQVQSDEAGLFRLELPPGTYILRPETTGRFPTAGDQTVEVVAGQFTQVTVLFDTGIR